MLKKSISNLLIVLIGLGASEFSFAMSSDLQCHGESTSNGTVKEYNLRVASNLKTFSLEVGLTPRQSSLPRDGRYQLYKGSIIPNIVSGSFRMVATAGVNYYPYVGPLEFPAYDQVFVGTLMLRSNETFIILSNGTQVTLTCAPTKM